MGEDRFSLFSNKVGFCLFIVLLILNFKTESGEIGSFEIPPPPFEKGGDRAQDGNLKILYSGADKIELLLLTPEFSVEPVVEESALLSAFEERAVAVSRASPRVRGERGGASVNSLPRLEEAGKEFHPVRKEAPSLAAGFEAPPKLSNGVHRLSVKGYGCLSEEGKPQLPMKGVLLSTPEEAEVTVKVSESEVLSFSGLSVYPENRDYDIGSEQKQPNPFNNPPAPLWKGDKGEKSVDSFYPGKLAEIGFSGYLRDARVVQLYIYPVQYNSFRKEVKLYTKLHITVEFVYKSPYPLFQRGDRGDLFLAPGSSATKSEISAMSKQSKVSCCFDNHSESSVETTKKGWERIYNHTIANAKSLRNSDFEGQTFHPSIPFTAPHLQPQTKYKLIIAQDGIYRLTYKDFLDAGIDVSSINPKTLKLTNKGKAVPLFVSGENDGKFDKEDYLEFHGEFNRGKYSLYGEYTTENVYWLSWGQENGARMVPLDVVKENLEANTPLSHQVVVHFEEDIFRGSLGYVDEKRDFWFWGNAAGKQTLKYPFKLHNVVNTAECKVRVMLHGLSTLEHHTKISLNGVELADFLWNGQREYLYEFTADLCTPPWGGWGGFSGLAESPPLMSTLLKDGENVLAFESVGDTPAGKADVVYFNWFEIEYWRAFVAVDDTLAFEIKEPGAYQFKLTGFSSKAIEVYKGKSCKLQNYKIFREGDAYSLTFFDEIVTPTKYLAICTHRKKQPKPQSFRSKNNKQVTALLAEDEPSFLRSPSNSADYIIIVYDDFYYEILPLAKHRSNKFRRKPASGVGELTIAVKVSDVYDEFSYGLLSPEAIRDFIRYAYHYWQKPSPTYVLLVGDATWDFKHGKNYVPTYYFNSFKKGQTATDNLYACVNGEDPLPDLFIGRLPTRTKENTQAVVEKIIRYEQSPNFGAWRRRLLMLAAAGSFEQDSERLLKDYVKPDDGYEVMRVYTNPKSRYYGETEQLLDFWNAGCSFVHFTGHGGGNIWSDEALFTLNDVQFLMNKSMPAFVTSFTCYTSYFDDPNQNCLNELFVTQEEGGAIAAFGSTGLGWLEGDYYMEQALFESLFTLDTRRLGEAILEAKVILMINYRNADMVNLYNLLGDAAVILPLPQEKIDIQAKLIKDSGQDDAGRKGMKGLQLEARGVIGKAGENSDFLEGSALLEVESGDDTLKFPKTELKIKAGKFDVTISPSKSPQELQASNQLLVRCYAWSDDKNVPKDAAGAFLLKIAGEDDIDLSVFSDDITFTAQENASASLPSVEGVGNASHANEVKGYRKVRIGVTVYNLGKKVASNVLVYFYAGNPFSGGFKIGEVVIPQIDGLGKAKAEIEWRTDVEKQTIHCQIDPKNEINELNEANNTAEKMLIFSVFTITPEAGSAGEIKSSDGNLQVRIEKGAVLESVMLSIESEAILPLIMQPQLQYSPLPSKTSGCAYRLRITKSDGGKEEVLAPQAVISLTFRYNEEIGDVGIFNYRDDLKQWEIALRKEEQEVDKQAHTILATVPLTQHFFDGLLFTLMVSADGTPPLIQLSIADERLPYDGFYASETPTLSATVSDTNGVGKILFFLNEKQVDFSDLSYSHTLNNTTAVSFSPTLTAGNYHLRVRAFDLCGNFSEETLSFNVGGEMKLLNVSNHPNPFKSETYFTYVLLDEAEYVTIKIYTTSGRLIAQLDAPARLGYNEILWDGKDKDGEGVANGVYFYKITVKTEKERLSHVGKLLVQG